MSNKRDFIFFCHSLCLTWILITPLPIYGRRAVNTWIDFLFTPATRFIRQNIFPQSPDFDGFITDSTNYLILLIWGVLLAVLFYTLYLKTKTQTKALMRDLVISALVYLLAWVFLVYGFSKVLGHQFPDISHLSFYNIDQNRDIVFWQWLGNSPVLVGVIGAFEIMTALILFYKPLRKIGLYLLALSSLTILAVNLTFGIGVVAFSSVLCLSSILLLFFSDFDAQKVSEVLGKFKKPIKLFAVISIVIVSIFHNYS